MIFEEKQKSQPIEKQQVWEAFNKVRSNKWASGVDNLSIQEVSRPPALADGQARQKDEILFASTNDK